MKLSKVGILRKMMVTEPGQIQSIPKTHFGGYNNKCDTIFRIQHELASMTGDLKSYIILTV